jgi:hypothetical protein
MNTATTPANDNTVIAVVNAATYRRQIGTIEYAMDCVRGSALRRELDHHLGNLRRTVLTINCTRLARANKPLEQEAIRMLRSAGEMLARHDRHE